MLNASRICPGEKPPADFSRRVVGHFFDFISEVAVAGTSPRAELDARIESVSGLDAYDDARRVGRGAVLVTAHMGSFEIGLAALARRESRIRVVFKRDPVGAFESTRARLRERLGVVEASIDSGPAGWLDLRDALLADDVVVIQGDRAVPGQRYEPVRVARGTLMVPGGPARLARMTGSPMIPVFVIRAARGRFRVILDAPIFPDDHPLPPRRKGVREIDPMTKAFAAAFERVLIRHPDQWLMLTPAFEEDRHAS